MIIYFRKQKREDNNIALAGIKINCMVPRNGCGVRNHQYIYQYT
jgi:hypothetical protein